MHCPIESMPGNKRKEFGLGAFTSRRLVFQGFAPAPRCKCLRQGLLSPHVLLWQ
jgi:hypothetical protein